MSDAPLHLKTLLSEHPGTMARQDRIAAPSAAGELDMAPIGPSKTRFDIAIQHVHHQRLIPRRCPVDEIFDDVTRNLD